MDHKKIGGSERGDRVEFNRRVRLDVWVTRLSSDGGLLVIGELDHTIELSGLTPAVLCDSRRGRKTVLWLDSLFLQSVYGRLAGYEGANDADRIALDPVMRQGMGDRAVDARAASASVMVCFETETLALPRTGRLQPN